MERDTPMKQRRLAPNMVRIPDSWAVAAPRTQDQRETSASSALADALRKARAPLPTDAVLSRKIRRHASTDPFAQHVAMLDESPHPSTSSYWNKLEIPKGYVGTCEDKSPKSGWVLPADEYVDLVIGYLCESKTWSLTEWDREEAATEMRKYLMDSLPAKFRKMVRWGKEGFLPNLYVHPKGK